MSTGEDPGKVEFVGLILGFSSAALSYLGYDSDGKPGGPKNPVLAQQNIEIIKLLRDKTTGNLSDEEARLLNQVLDDLMRKFADCCK